MDDLISRQAALEKVRAMQTYKLFVGDDMILVDKAEVQTELMMLPTAQQERIIYGNMSDEEFEKWLYGHGICSPNIREPIPCAVVPLLIDDAISELPSAQPDVPDTNVGDLISRQAAIDALEERKGEKYETD